MVVEYTITLNSITQYVEASSWRPMTLAAEHSHQHYRVSPSNIPTCNRSCSHFKNTHSHSVEDVTNEAMMSIESQLIVRNRHAHSNQTSDPGRSNVGGR